MLSSQSTIIIPKEVVEENGDLTQVAVGSGPFKFVEYVPNTHVKLEKFADYFEEGVPYVDNLELLIAAEDNIAHRGARAGDGRLHRVRPVAGYSHSRG